MKGAMPCIVKSALANARYLPLWLGTGAVIWSMPTAWAEEWYVRPMADVQAQFNDNQRLTVAPHADVWGAVGEAGLELGVRSLINQLSLTPSLRTYRYTGEQGLDHIGENLDMTFYHGTEESAFNLSANYNLDSTLTSELLASGLVQTNERRRATNIQPSWSTSWSPYGTFRIDGGFSGVAYNDSLAAGLFNYRYDYGGATLGYRLMETQSLNLTASVARYDATDIRYLADTYSVQAGLESNWSPHTRTNISAGTQVDKTRVAGFFGPVYDTQSGFVINALTRTESELTTWQLDLSRSVVPSGIGALVQQDQGVLSATRRLAIKVDGSVAATWLHSQSLQNSIVSQDRTLQQLDLSVEWRFAAEWSVRGQYSLVIQDIDQKAEANSVVITLAFNNKKHAISY